MSISAIYPIDHVLTKLRDNGKFQDAYARDLFAKVQMACDTGATIVMLSGAEYDYFVSLHIETREEKAV